MVIIAFDSQELRELCEQAERADEMLGKRVASRLRRRLADIEAASELPSMVVGNPRVVTHSAVERMVVDLVDGFELVFVANHPKNPRNSAGRVDWAKVSRIRIVGLSNDTSSS